MTLQIRAIKLLTAAVLIAGFNGAFASDVRPITPAEPTEPTVENLMAISGLKASLDGLPSQMVDMLFGNMPKSVPDEAKRALGKAYAEAYPPESLSKAITAGLKGKLDPSKVPTLMRVASSPIALKMTQLENTKPKEEELQAFAASLSSKPPKPERVRLIKELLDTSQNVDTLATMIAATQESVAQATSSGCADDRKRIHDEFAKAKPAIRQATYVMQMSGLLFVYRSATDDELGRYIDTYRDRDSKALHTVLNQLIAQEYLSRWKTFEKTLIQFGGDLSDRSMFSKSCRSRASAAGATIAAIGAGPADIRRERKSSPVRDARECLKLEDSRKTMACAERFR